MESEPIKVEAFEDSTSDTEQPKKETAQADNVPKETEAVKFLPSAKLDSIEIPANISVDSSTDTIVPHGDVIIATNGIEKAL